MEPLIKRLTERQEALERGVFSHPPSNWDEFSKRLGRWIELQLMITEVNGEDQERERLERAS